MSVLDTLHCICEWSILVVRNLRSVPAQVFAPAIGTVEEQEVFLQRDEESAPLVRASGAGG